MTYMISYMRDRLKGGEELTYADFVYITMSRSLINGMSGMLGGILANKIGLKPTLIVGAAFYT